MIKKMELYHRRKIYRILRMMMKGNSKTLVHGFWKSINPGRKERLGSPGALTLYIKDKEMIDM